jgi:dolichyl-phosphate beta-glucosyltransferase
VTAREAPDDGGGPVSLSLVIPAYNEEARLPAGMARLDRAVTMGSIDPSTTEFVVVDDGSTDATSGTARDLLSGYPYVQSVRFEHNQGKGAAVRAGVAVAKAPLIAFADADMAIDPAQTPSFVGALARADLAIGSRAARGSSVDRPSISRSVMNRVFNRFVNLLTQVSLDDTQCGFKAFRAPVAKLLFHCSVTERMAFDVEILSLARRLGLPIEQVPVQWLRVGGSRVRSWSDSRSMIRDVLRTRRTLPRAPGIEGFRVTPVAPAPATLERFALHLPVLDEADGRALVLCPLTDETGVASLLDAAESAGLQPERTVVTLDQLAAQGPLLLRRGGVSVVAPSGRAFEEGGLARYDGPDGERATGHERAPADDGHRSHPNPRR